MIAAGLMALYLVTPIASEPLTVAEAKLHCRIDHADDDVLMAGLITAAREYAESFTHRALAAQTWDLKLDGFPCADELWLPMPPATAITSISYVDGAGTTQTWGASNYTTEFPSGPHAQRARITPAFGVSWPVTRSVINAVTVRFVAGYTSCPESIKAAMKLLIGHWYRNRESVVGTISGPLQQGVESLLWPFKAF
jgi:uncharacterized phiE125 gp8 family phage protein